MRIWQACLTGTQADNGAKLFAAFSVYATQNVSYTSRTLELLPSTGQTEIPPIAKVSDSLPPSFVITAEPNLLESMA